MQRLFDVDNMSFIDVDNPTSIRFAFSTILRCRFDVGSTHTHINNKWGAETSKHQSKRC